LDILYNLPRYDVTIYLDEIVCRAVMTMRGISTERKTPMTTMSIMVVLLASLCLLFSLHPVLNPNKSDSVAYSVTYPFIIPACSALTLLAISFCLLLSALLMAENRRMFRMTRDTQGIRWTKTTRNL
jgi:hypothetical protein